MILMADPSSSFPADVSGGELIGEIIRNLAEMPAYPVVGEDRVQVPVTAVREYQHAGRPGGNLVPHSGEGGQRGARRSSGQDRLLLHEPPAGRDGVDVADQDHVVGGTGLEQYRSHRRAVTGQPPDLRVFLAEDD